MPNNKMSSFLWVYPLLFCLDALLSVVDDGISYFFPVQLLSSIRQVTANCVFFLGAPFLFSLFYYETKQLRTYVLLPIYNLSFSIFSGLNLINLVSSTSLFSLLAL